ncbi:MAG: ASKHA domain-containing protein [Tepidisphaerales bacterium]
MDQKKLTRVDVEYSGGVRVLEVEPGVKSLADVLGDHGLPLNTRCGQEGLCDGCEVELLEGTLLDRSTRREARVYTGHCVQACQCVVGDGPVRLQLPQRSMLSHKASALVDFSLNVSSGHDPLWQGVGELMGPALGLAIDVGTTTVAVMLVDLTEDRVLARASDFNGQMRLGDDVVTRISRCARDPEMIGRLQEAVVATIVSLVREVLKTAGAAARQLVCGAVAGNTTMLHLLAGVDPTPMGTAPFTPAFLEHRVVHTREIRGWPADEMGLELHLLPSASAYVGSDLTAGCLASGLAYDHGPSLLVDAGTNGEIILKLGVKFYGCATAAGPAFEGAGLSCGMRAAPGAISHLRWRRGRFVADVLGGEGILPMGLCGSAYVDFLAEARNAGLLSSAGRFAAGWEHALTDSRHGRACRVGRGASGDVVVSEADVSRLLTAKAAIAAGILMLLAQEKLEARQIKTVYLAGGFGTQIRPESAIGCGLLPGFRVEQIEPVGNSALGGAYLSLVDRRAMEEVRRVAKKVEVVELNLDPAFEATYIDQLALP